jgi:hypothetical protein
MMRRFGFQSFLKRILIQFRRNDMTTRILMTATLVALCMAGTANAAELITVGGGSYHFERDLGHNEFNYGLGYERDWDDSLSWSVGVYKNSIRRASFYG